MFRSIGLFEDISDRHYSPGLFLTHQRGQVPIGGIFISLSLSISSGDYFPFASVPSEHRALWIKIKISFNFGCVLHYVPPFSSRRIKYDNHRTVQRSNELCEQFLLDRVFSKDFCGSKRY